MTQTPYTHSIIRVGKTWQAHNTTTSLVCRLIVEKGAREHHAVWLAADLALAAALRAAESEEDRAKALKGLDGNNAPGVLERLNELLDKLGLSRFMVLSEPVVPTGV